ncbi:hypothetical protein [uncultured Tateyamaria sp.]|uniref:hypothetical protein n=1 Tax=uncultured Tateyamaria sp. TaxID=455651 RepID=UPI0026224082|nr:hypothetical protein [uncultured Tateyamaria sp.]
MDYESGFGPDNADFSSGYGHEDFSTSTHAPSTLDMPRRDNVVTFPGTARQSGHPLRDAPQDVDHRGLLGADSDLWARDVFLICENGSAESSTMTGLSESMQSLTILYQFPSALHLAARCDGSEALLAVNLDMIEDLDDTIEQLSKLRETNSTLAVLIMSRSFAQTDFHPKRSHIADASLRLPASKYEMSVALHFAVTNAFFRTSYDGRD